MRITGASPGTCTKNNRTRSQSPAGATARADQATQRAGSKVAIDFQCQPVAFGGILDVLDFVLGQTLTPEYCFHN
jgi:hypothetical protein